MSEASPQSSNSASSSEDMLNYWYDMNERWNGRFRHLKMGCNQLEKRHMPLLELLQQQKQYTHSILKWSDVEDLHSQMIFGWYRCSPIIRLLMELTFIELASGYVSELMVPYSTCRPLRSDDLSLLPIPHTHTHTVKIQKESIFNCWP